MSIGVFTEKKVRPSEEEIAAALGPLLPAYQALAAFIRQTYPVQEAFKFMYGKNYGWALYFQMGKKLLTALYPTRDSFAVQVNLPEAAIQEALGMRLGPNVEAAIAAAHPYPEGRWLFISIRSESELEAIRRLLALRVSSRGLQKAK